MPRFQTTMRSRNGATTQRLAHRQHVDEEEIELRGLVERQGEERDQRAKAGRRHTADLPSPPCRESGRGVAEHGRDASRIVQPLALRQYGRPQQLPSAQGGRGGSPSGSRTLTRSARPIRAALARRGASRRGSRGRSRPRARSSRSGRICGPRRGRGTTATPLTSSRRKASARAVAPPHRDRRR